MLDITKVKTFEVPPTFKALQDSNYALKTTNEVLRSKNDRLQKILIITVISMSLVLIIRLLKNQTTKRINENSNNQLRSK